MIAIVNYGIGNLLAIQNIIRKVGGTSIVTDDPEQIRKADKLILPGVGAFGYGMNQLRSRGLIEVLNEQVLKDKKLTLGLCLGAQLMTQQSEEDNAQGLGWVQGKTIKFDDQKVNVIPHMGWSDVEFVKNSALTNNLQEPRFYFTHSYHFLISNEKDVLGYSEYGYKFACAFQVENITGFQFHPEKSHKFGMKLFENFIGL
jgi:imidazole glycerol-phosphate synthase subunit HisH